MADFDPSSGPVLYTALEYAQRWQDEYRTTIHPSFTIVPDGNAELPPETALLFPVADALSRIDGKIGLVWDSMASDTAEGRALDNINNLAGVEGRRPGTKTTVSVAVVGTPNQDVSGQRVIHDPTRLAFLFPDGVSIDANGNLTTTLTAETLGPIDIAVNETQWSTAPLNAAIDTITATADSQRGAFPMSDEEYRIFAEQLPGSKTVSIETAVNAAISKVPNVSRWLVDNNRSPNLTVDGVPGWEVETIVEGGTDSDIMLALYNSLPITVASFGDVFVTDPSGKIQRFSRPIVVDCRVFVLWENSGSQNVLDAETRAFVTAQIEQAVVDHISPATGLGYNIGRDLVPDELYTVVAPIIPQGAIKTLEILASRVSDPPVETPTEMGNKERVRVQIGNSLVVIN